MLWMITSISSLEHRSSINIAQYFLCLRKTLCLPQFANDILTHRSLIVYAHRSLILVQVKIKMHVSKKQLLFLVLRSRRLHSAILTSKCKIKRKRWLTEQTISVQRANSVLVYRHSLPRCKNRYYH